MADRVAASRAGSSDSPEPLGVRHCFVTGRHGRLPGLLLSGTSVQVVGTGGCRPVFESGGWVVVDEWLPAGLLDPA